MVDHMTAPDSSLIPPTSVAVVETASSAVAAQARASVEARYLVALQRPRSWVEARLKLLEACKRSRFAETAMYEKPIGSEKITGPSIRFVEEALRAAQNVLAEAIVLFDDADRRIIRVQVTDLEANLCYPQDIIIQKTVERRFPRKGQTVIGQREKTRGETVYIVEASEDELLVKQQALTSKSLRTSGLRLIPSDIVEEAIDQIIETVKSADEKDPTAARKRVVDLFYVQGVGPADLVEYLGHAVEKMNNAELNQLRLVYQAIKEGESTWPAVMEQRKGAATAGSGEAKAAPTGAAGLKEKLGSKKEAAPTKSDEQMDREILERDAAREAQGGAR
jgi:hypothetical protein